MSNMFLVGVAFVGILLLLYGMGVPVAYAMGLTGITMMILPLGPDFSIEVIAQRMYSGMDSFVLLAIPFFLFAGRIMNVIGMTRDIFDFAEATVEPLPGGLGHVNIVVSMIFSGMSGAAVADAAGLGAIEYKAMTDRGYDPGFSAGITGSSATIGPIIPPSIPLIVYGVLAQVSIGALFIAGIVPGILMGLLLMATVTYIAVKEGWAEAESYDLSKLVSSSIRAIPALLAPVIIVGGIMVGFFTATEAAVVAVFYAIALGLFYYRSLDGEKLYDISKQTAIDSAALILIIGIADMYGFLVTISGLPSFFAENIVGVSDSTMVILFLLVGVLLLLGTFMETLAIILITVPILTPILPELGIDLLFFGIVMVVTLMIGLITPPFGVNLFVLERVTALDLDEIMRGMVPFYLPLLLVLVLIIVFPDLVMFLPEYFGFA